MAMAAIQGTDKHTRSSFGVQYFAQGTLRQADQGSGTSDLPTRHWLYSWSAPLACYQLLVKQWKMEMNSVKCLPCTAAEAESQHIVVGVIAAWQVDRLFDKWIWLHRDTALSNSGVRADIKVSILFNTLPWRQSDFNGCKLLVLSLSLGISVPPYFHNPHELLPKSPSLHEQ